MKSNDEVLRLKKRVEALEKENDTLTNQLIDSANESNLTLSQQQELNVTLTSRNVLLVSVLKHVLKGYDIMTALANCNQEVGIDYHVMWLEDCIADCIDNTVTIPEYDQKLHNRVNHYLYTLKNLMLDKEVGFTNESLVNLENVRNILKRMI